MAVKAAQDNNNDNNNNNNNNNNLYLDYLLPYKILQKMFKIKLEYWLPEITIGAAVFYFTIIVIIFSGKRKKNG